MFTHDANFIAFEFRYHVSDVEYTCNGIVPMSRVHGWRANRRLVQLFLSPRFPTSHCGAAAQGICLVMDRGRYFHDEEKKDRIVRHRSLDDSALFLSPSISLLPCQFHPESAPFHPNSTTPIAPGLRVEIRLHPNKPAIEAIFSFYLRSSSAA